MINSLGGRGSNQRALGRARWTGLVIFAVAMLTLAGCSGSSGSSSATSSVGRPSSAGAPSVVVTASTGLPSGAAEDGSDQAVWGSAGELQLVLYGSSTCPRLPTSVTKTDSNTITVTTAQQNATGPCTFDLVPTTATVHVPDGINDQQTVQISIDGHTSQLAPR